MTDNIIVLEQVNKFYLETGKKLVVKNFSLEIQKGDFFCLVGPSGCGKSTVLKLIAGLEEPSSGKIIKPETVGMVFQLGALFPWLAVEDNVGFGLDMKGLSNTEVKHQSLEYLKMVNLENFAKKYPRELSGGQRQRVGIARALAINPEVLLLDEPFSALDFLTTDELHQDLLKIWQETGKTIVMVSHSLEEAVILADKVGVMEEGKLLGVIDISYERPRKEQGEKFFTEVNKIKKLFS